MSQKTYLGDGVYAEFEDGMIKLYTSNGMLNSEPIYLEDSVMNALEAFADKVFGMKL